MEYNEASAVAQLLSNQQRNKRKITECNVVI